MGEAHGRIPAGRNSVLGICQISLVRAIRPPVPDPSTPEPSLFQVSCVSPFPPLLCWCFSHSALLITY